MGAIVYAYMMQSGGLGSGLQSVVGGDINSRIDKALLSTTIDASEFGVGSVTLVNGKALVKAVESSGNGFITIGKPRAVAVSGDNADVYALVSINGGGTGTFQYLTHFEFIGSTNQATEVQKVLLGDRIVIDDIRVEFTAPAEYQVLVSLKDRKPGEPMVAEPTEARVLHFAKGADGLKLTALTFGTLEEHDVVLFGPFPGEEVETSFNVTGAARGSWYFEASFPVQLKTLDGQMLAGELAQAQGDWMTTELVPFTARIIAPSTAKGLHTLVIKKDNPSGLPEHEKEYEIPVVLK